MLSYFSMPDILDFHIHSKYSRACSKNLELSQIAEACVTKGITIVGTGDFTHPKWFSDIQAQLIEVRQGIYKVKGSTTTTEFILTAEISCIYKQGEKTRRVHLILLAPNFDAIQKLIVALENRKCNLHSDGRPIIGLSAKELLKICLEISPDFEMIPAHAWTPWFAVFGSKSGFDSLEECFEELTPYIHAIETGLSSDPTMNGRLSKLDHITLVSNSDAHGLENLGREANVMQLSERTYDEIISVLHKNDAQKFLYTIEFYPEEGKYHTDGHELCKFSCTPEETKKNGGLCQKCKKLLTVGVLSRVQELADRGNGIRAIPHRYIVPLKEIISAVIGVGKSSKKVDELYSNLITKLGSEFYILLHANLIDISYAGNAQIAEGVRRVRAGEVFVKPGYDGVFGAVSVLRPDEKLGEMQMKLM